MTETPEIAAVLVAAAVVTYLCRLAGVLAATRVGLDGALFRWVDCVAYALLSALVARMILLPLGPLQHVPLWGRLVATAAAVAVFFLSRRRVLAGVAVGVGMVALLASL